jgi:prolyl-tRNA synthetase
VLVARRDTREKQSLAMDGLPQRILQLLEEAQANLFQRARQFREEHTQRASSYAEFKEIMEGRPGFVIAPWCGSSECEAQIKADTQATIRNMPIDGATPSGMCVRGDNPAKFEAWFAKAY